MTDAHTAAAGTADTDEVDLTALPADELLKLDAQVCFALHVAGRAFDAMYRSELGELDLTYSQYLVMLVLWEQDDVTVKELGARLRLDSGTLSPLLKRLEQAGIIRRCRSEHDERSVAVRLTEHGAGLKDQASEVPRRILESTGLDSHEVRALRDTLTRVAERLDAARAS